MNIAERLKNIRTHKKLSQKEIALTVGIDRAQYSRFESGKVEPTLPTLRKISEALEIKLADLFSEEENFDVNSYEKTLVEKVRMIDQLENDQQKIIFGVIDTALANKKMKDVMSKVLSDVA
jgi:transcriptional regulator with XRE-family HTH domain